MKQQITQAELRAVLELETEVNRRMIQIRERLRMGAAIERGELGAVAHNSDDMDPICAGYDNMGLDIDDRESTEQRTRWMQEADAARRRSKITVMRRYAVPEVANV